jgi:transcriptional regulator with XRE-family HTH domain
LLSVSNYKVDGGVKSVTIDTVRTISETIRQAVVDTGLPLQQVAEAAGVDRASLSRFVRGERSLRLDIADRLAEFLGLELRPNGRRHSRNKP